MAGQESKGTRGKAKELARAGDLIDASGVELLRLRVDGAVHRFGFEAMNPARCIERCARWRRKASLNLPWRPPRGGPAEGCMITGRGREACLDLGQGA